MPRTIAMRGWMFVSAISLLAAVLSASCWPIEARAGSRHSRLLSSSGTHKGRNLGAGSQGSVKAWAPSASGKHSGGTRNEGQSGYGTYNPKSIRRFWSHYHGERRKAKSKPLEREK
jgi:hypothetical protein